ncbi:MAG: ComF family protein [Parvibaculales bacterium]
MEKKKTLLGKIINALNRVTNFMIPFRCSACMRIIESEGGVCGYCWGKIRFIEKPICPILGAPFPFEVAEGTISARALAHPPAFDHMRSVFFYEGVGQEILHRFKFARHTEIAKTFAPWMLRAGGEIVKNCDIIIPIPLHRGRYVSRSFNQSSELGRHIHYLTKLPIDTNSLIRIRATPPQSGLSGRERRANIKNAFIVRERKKHLIRHKRVLLIDDVYTTGATIHEACRVLRRSKAASIEVLTLARVEFRKDSYHML